VLIDMRRQLRCLRSGQRSFLAGPMRRRGRGQGRGSLSQHERRGGARD
jgi:hypothetical protein